jgi:alpha-tubulin suppressor-like RCC1 family protein
LGDGTAIDSTVPVAVSGLTGVKEVGVGGSYGCALDDGGGVKCWGDNGYGRLGSGSTAFESLTPVPVSGLSSNVLSLSVGGLHACVVTTQGGVKCWGYNGYGQLGNGLITDSNVPVDVAGLAGGVKAVSAGGTHTCALLDTGAVKCWGSNVYGQLGDGADLGIVANRQRLTPVDVVDVVSAVAVSAGSGYSTCALQADGQVKCWGNNRYYGILGDGTVTEGVDSRSSPTTVVGLSGSGVSAIHVGSYHACAVASGGRLRCWGDNENGQLGAAVRRGSSPFPAPGVPDFQLATGISHNLLVNAKGEVWAWGDNTAGKLGNGTTAVSAVPVRAGTLSNVVAVAAGMGHSLALRSDGTVWAWGLNSDGQLGIGDLSPSTCTVPGDDSYKCATTPVQVTGLTDVIAIAAGWRHSLALVSDGTVWQWGNENQGLVRTGKTVPTQITGFLGPIERIAAGYMHSVAIDWNRRVYAWGRGDLGELGPSKPDANSTTPIPVTRLGNYFSAYDVVAGGGFTVALSRQGTPYTWGSNAYGALGDPTLGTDNGFGEAVRRSTPESIEGLVVEQASAGFGFVLARKGDGSAWAWGLGSRGQLGGAVTSGFCGVNTVNLVCAKAPSPAPAHDGSMLLSAGGAHGIAVRVGGALVAFGDNARGQLGSTAGTYGNNFTQIYYDPSFTRTPEGTFGSPIGVGTTSETGQLSVGMGSGIAFAGQKVGTISSPVALSIKNLSSTASINITGVTATGDFRVSHNCSTLAGGASCTASVTFAPSSLGTRTGVLVVSSNASNSTSISVSLSGTGLDARATSATALRSASGSTAIEGAPVTFVASVTSTSTVTGTADFSYTNSTTQAAGAIAGCTGMSLATNGEASCTTAALPAGSLQISARYSGSTTVQPSNSPNLAFNVVQVKTLTVATAGAGYGSVTSFPAGINCPGDCSESYASTTSVTLTATPSAGSAFAGWSGDCGGTAACTVSMTAARNVTATFTANAAGGKPVTRYRLYKPGVEHLYTTNPLEYAYLSNQIEPACCGWQAEGPIYRIFDGPATFSGAPAVPYYRLYNPFSGQHHWTTDLNEYTFLPQYGWQQEGPDGYILKEAVAGAIPLYRLYINCCGGPHLWTVDAGEVNALTTLYGWELEGIAGYVLPLP